MEVFIGYIFLPENPDIHYQSIRLNIEKNNIIIEISEDLSQFEYPLLLGVFTGFGRATFIKCKYIGIRSGSGGQIIKFRVDYLLKNIHLLSLKDLIFQSIYINIPALYDWLGKSIIKQQISENNISLETHPDIKYEISNEFDLLFYFHIQRQFQENEFNLREIAGVQINSKDTKLTLWRFLELWNVFRKFLLIITNYNVESEYISFYDKEKIDYSLEFLHTDFDSQMNNSSILPSVAYNNISGNVGNILKSWFSNKDLFASIDLILEKSINPRLSKENTFLNTCFSIETLHRKSFDNKKPYSNSEFKTLKKQVMSNITDKSFCDFLNDKFSYANEISFKDRLRYFSNDFAAILPLSINTEDYIARIVKTRNYLVHGGSYSCLIFEKNEMNWAAQYIEFIVKINLFRIIGIDVKEIERIVNDSKRYFNN